MLVVVSQLRCGHTRGSGSLLQKGRNRFDETSLTKEQRRFIDSLVRARIATLEEPTADDLATMRTALPPSPPEEPPSDPPIVETGKDAQFQVADPVTVNIIDEASTPKTSRASQRANRSR